MTSPKSGAPSSEVRPSHSPKCASEKGDHGSLFNKPLSFLRKTEENERRLNILNY